MPYVTQLDRNIAISCIREWAVFQRRNEVSKLTAGQVNYFITRLLDDWRPRRDDGSTSYDGINAAVGVLECAKQEMYARVARPYEDRKKAENGDVYR